jgi:hypothetical protein
MLNCHPGRLQIFDHFLCVYFLPAQISIFNLTNNHELDFSFKVPVAVQVPRGLAVIPATNWSNERKLICIADKANHQIYIFHAETGKVVTIIGLTETQRPLDLYNEWGNRRDEEYIFDEPADVTISDNMLAVLDSGHNCIKYYNLMNFRYQGRLDYCGIGGREMKGMTSVLVSKKYLVLIQGKRRFRRNRCIHISTRK